SLFSPWLGLFFWAPWTALALLAPRWLRRFDLVPVAVVAYYLVFQITHALWRSGWTVGPRYITPVAPFAAMSVALVVREAPRLLPMLRGLGAAAVATTGLASAARRPSLHGALSHPANASNDASRPRKFLTSRAAGSPPPGSRIARRYRAAGSRFKRPSRRNTPNRSFAITSDHMYV